MNKDKARFNMVEQQIRPWNVLDPVVLDLMASIPREMFVPEKYKAFAFADFSIPLLHGQQMFSPKEEARMLQALALSANDKVLEIGTGTGFTTALIASIAKKVLTIEIYPEFVTEAEECFRKLNLNNITAEVTDISEGWKPSERFDAIVITAALSGKPEHYLSLLNSGGRLFSIEGPDNNQYAKLYVKKEQGVIEQQSLFEISTPRLIHERVSAEFVF